MKYNGGTQIPTTAVIVFIRYRTTPDKETLDEKNNFFTAYGNNSSAYAVVLRELRKLCGSD